LHIDGNKHQSELKADANRIKLYSSNILTLLQYPVLFVCGKNVQINLMFVRKIRAYLVGYSTCVGV
jgi:hypothetical protein